MIVECWQRGKLVAIHRASPELTAREVLSRFGLGENWTVITYGQDDETSMRLSGRPSERHTIQTERG